MPEVKTTPANTPATGVAANIVSANNVGANKKNCLRPILPPLLHQTRRLSLR